MNMEPLRLRLVPMDEHDDELERRRRGFWLRMARERARYTQAAVAELIGYRGTSKSSVNAWEEGRRPVPLDKLKALARLYAVPVEMFVNPESTAYERIDALVNVAGELERADWEAGDRSLPPASDDSAGGQGRSRR